MKSPAFIAIARVIAVGMGFVSTIVIARSLGPSGRGESSAAIASLYIAPLILGLGMPLAVRRHAAIGQAEESVRTARKFALVLVPLSALAAFGLIVGPLVTLAPDARLAFFVGMLSTPFAVLCLVDQGVLVARQDYLAVAIIMLAPPAVYLAGLLITAITGTASVATVIVSNVAGIVATAVFAAARVHTPIRGPSIGFAAMTKESLSYAGAQIAEAAAVRLPQLILLPLVGATQLGFFVIGDTLAATPLALAYALNARFYTSIVLAPPAEVAAQQANAIRAGLLWSAIATVGLLVVAPILVPIAFGPEFSAAVLPSVLSALGTVGLVTAQTVASAMAAVRRGTAMTICQVGGLAVTIILMAITAPSGGAVAGAISAAIGSTVNLALLLAAVRVPLRDYRFDRSRARDAVRSLVTG